MSDKLKFEVQENLYLGLGHATQRLTVRPTRPSPIKYIAYYPNFCGEWRVLTVMAQGHFVQGMRRLRDVWQYINQAF